MITVIGMGPGDPGLMTAQAAKAVASARIVFAARRHAHLKADIRPLEPIETAVQRIGDAARDDAEVAVLVSGDPTLYSLLGMLERAFGREALRVIPGVGALQAFCAEIGVLWQEAGILSGHGRALTVSRLGHHVRTTEKTFLYCDRAHDAAWAANALMREGLADVRMCVAERLSCADQRIRYGRPEDFTAADTDALSMVYIRNDGARPGLPPVGIPD
ncbi:MAG: precorrin-6y C5,15-methyltransferase (decarboxylating) subunit CbiE, partial [Clostridiales bacterium]|nr:precorrin-6y C5,15-methyltransferase (decarboxylating) subunit CbiE [Clostridiales bacterium]